ncbi:exonuclease [Planoprotostelium fungivorum]|uniref:Exonuclease n=1 Tax=Planoprotostelium fungivorum TaxID=1890364 RepID=A0A2P6MW78_9EUKA|nr:exonuclease [Planoprotostelium fungivorum]
MDSPGSDDEWESDGSWSAEDDEDDGEIWLLVKLMRPAEALPVHHSTLSTIYNGIITIRDQLKTSNQLLRKASTGSTAHPNYQSINRELHEAFYESKHILKSIRNDSRLKKPEEITVSSDVSRGTIDRDQESNQSQLIDVSQMKEIISHHANVQTMLETKLENMSQENEFLRRKSQEGRNPPQTKGKEKSSRSSFNSRSSDHLPRSSITIDELAVINSQLQYRNQELERELRAARAENRNQTKDLSKRAQSLNDQLQDEIKVMRSSYEAVILERAKWDEKTNELIQRAVATTKRDSEKHHKSILLRNQENAEKRVESLTRRVKELEARNVQLKNELNVKKVSAPAVDECTK